MGKKAKVGKSRKDRFYHLAKETGYRSRAAFKLIQLNRKYEFLQRSNVIVDLCAAPGGWLQVAAENAPMSNIIIGIDLVPIPPIKNVKTFQEDITSEKCRQVLKKELHTAKADCFLNDGAPNLGKSWVHDAYMQAELTLHALKLSTEFLRRGGWFITKLFRSKDYDPLMWVFQQLFKHVHATKPQASRNESAEIFVVCQGFVAPDKIDPKFLDPRHVFQEVDKTQRLAIDLIHPEKKKRQREGYPEGDYTLFHSLPVTEFLASDDYMDLLAQSSEIALDSEEVKNHPLTTPEIKECIKDIKVLGKKEIKGIFLWRKRLLKVLDKTGESEADTQSKPDEGEEEEEGEEQEEEMDEAEMEEIENMLEEKNKEELAAMKRAKKKVRKAQMKQKMRIDMKMTIPGDQPVIQDDINMFDIKKIRTHKALSEVEQGDLSYMDKEDIFEDSDDDDQSRTRPRKYFDRDEKEYHGVDSEDDDDVEMEEEPDFEGAGEESVNAEEESEDEVEAGKDNGNPLIIDMGQTSRIKQDKQAAWFKKAAFAGLDSDEDEDLELEQMLASKQEKTETKGKKVKERKQKKDEKSGDDIGKNKEKKSSVNGAAAEDSDDEDDDEEDEEDADEDPLLKLGDEEGMGDSSEDSGNDSDYDFSDVIHTSKKQRKKSKVSEKTTKVVNGVEIVPTSSIDPGSHLDAEGLAIGAAMVHSRKRRREIVDSGYHRYMFDDQNLPDWFTTDERKHMKRQRPVSKEEMEEYKLKQKAVDAQPIKKIAEAKARKKQKILKRTEKARKKANTITDAVDVSEKEKWQQIKQVYKKAGLLNKAKPKVTYVVAKKGAGRKVRRPAGVKGQFKVVDGRMKKDVRGMKKAEARQSNKKGGKGGSNKGGKKKSGGHRVRR